MSENYIVYNDEGNPTYFDRYQAEMIEYAERELGLINCRNDENEFDFPGAGSIKIVRRGIVGDEVVVLEKDGEVEDFEGIKNHARIHKQFKLSLM